MNENIKKALNYLDKLGINYRYAEHEAVYTIQEANALGMDDGKDVAKNLFLRDGKRKHYFLVIIDQHKNADLKAMACLLGVDRLSFASENDLMKYLGLTRGAVTPLGIINDEECRVKVIIDKTIMGYCTVAVHPNSNTASVWISPDELVRLVKEHGNETEIMDM